MAGTAYCERPLYDLVLGPDLQPGDLAKARVPFREAPPAGREERHLLVGEAVMRLHLTSGGVLQQCVIESSFIWKDGKFTDYAGYGAGPMTLEDAVAVARTFLVQLREPFTGLESWAKDPKTIRGEGETFTCGKLTSQPMIGCVIRGSAVPSHPYTIFVKIAWDRRTRAGGTLESPLLAGTTLDFDPPGGVQTHAEIFADRPVDHSSVTPTRSVSTAVPPFDVSQTPPVGPEILTTDTRSPFLSALPWLVAALFIVAALWIAFKKRWT